MNMACSTNTYRMLVRSTDCIYVYCLVTAINSDFFCTHINRLVLIMRKQRIFYEVGIELNIV